MTGKSKIAFIKLGSFSHINDSVEAQLARWFPEKELLVVDLASGFFKPRMNAIQNRLRVWLRHGPELLSGQREYWDCVYHTPSVFEASRRWLTELLEPVRGDLAFTFQTQSLFNAALPGIPHVVYTDHTHLATLTYPGFERRHLFGEDWIALEKGIYASASLCLTMSSYVQRSLMKDYDCLESKIRCVRAGGNTSGTAVKKDPDRFRKKQILFIGTDWKRKGGVELLTAFRSVLKKHPDARLLIIGCAPAIEAENCSILGFLPLEEVTGHYADSSVFCLPTRNEPFGISVVEAMQHGMPVITTNIGAMPDMIRDGENGFLVSPGDSSSLADAIEKLLASPDLCARMGQNGIAIARADYNWDVVGQRIEQSIRAIPSVKA